jgi:hypothetical protein
VSPIVKKLLVVPIVVPPELAAVPFDVMETLERFKGLIICMELALNAEMTLVAIRFSL